VNAKKEKLQGPAALQMAHQSNELFVGKGKKVVHLNLKKEPATDEEILKLMLGPTGNLRAPTLRTGKKLIVGFNQEMYEGLFG
jgi:arsenate reductase-like glutaredoxin family protein